jgi:exodeoxyribonuclease-3
MRLLAWNIRQGGGSRLPAIVEALARHEADVLVLSEYRGGDSALRLREMLARLGYPHITTPLPPPGKTGVLVAARRRFRAHAPLSDALPEPYRLVHVEIGKLSLCGVYMPNLLAKVPYWEAVVASLATKTDGHALAIGDFNTCRAYVDEPGAIDRCAHFMDRVADLGFCDLWRHRYPEGREFSWYSHRGNGFRIDHTFLSPALARRAGPVRYSHDERSFRPLAAAPRSAGLGRVQVRLKPRLVRTSERHNVSLPGESRDPLTRCLGRRRMGPGLRRGASLEGVSIRNDCALNRSSLSQLGRQVVAPVAAGIPAPGADRVALPDQLFDLGVDLRNRKVAVCLGQIERIQLIPDHGEFRVLLGSQRREERFGLSHAGSVDCGDKNEREARSGWLSAC